MLSSLQNSAWVLPHPPKATCTVVKSTMNSRIFNMFDMFFNTLHLFFLMFKVPHPWTVGASPSWHLKPFAISAKFWRGAPASSDVAPFISTCMLLRRVLGELPNRDMNFSLCFLKSSRGWSPHSFSGFTGHFFFFTSPDRSLPRRLERGSFILNFLELPKHGTHTHDL